MDIEGDQAFVLTFPERDAPLPGLDIPGIDGIAQQDRHALVGHPSGRAFGKQRFVLQEAHDFRLVFELAVGVAFEHALDN
ncbi:hypothetical protein [Nitratireductor sp. StC3]|uniref:hypothetical protein n=1 Tax=Nitratireductor sp. StC3 TaxID=2126741 RepID=UPI000D0CB061|nr:hypothetical protein [Nitratireductor sp. StC3]PSM16679.1 hypothetical protein C7T96_18545 [Nitratireductor sp. StC3]